MLLLVLAVVLAVVTGYLWIGLHYVSPRWITREVDARIRRLPHTARTPGQVEEWRHEMAVLSVGIAFAWPLHLAGRVLVGWVAGKAPLTDYELKIKAEQQARRIGELERECEVLRRAQDA